MNDKLLNLVNAFLEYLATIRGYSKQTIITYQIVLSQMVEACEFYEEEGRTVLDIMAYRLTVAANSKRTIAKKLSAIRSLVRYLSDQHDIDIDLVGDASIKVPQTLPKPIEEQYLKEVLGEANIADRLLVTMLYGLGLRISELSELALSKISSEWLEVRGKGDKVRQMPLMPHVHELIATYCSVHNPKNYLFEKNALPMSSAQLRYRVTKLFKSRGIKATPHQLRHSFATHLLNGGARISDISELLGHSSMATTQIYTKLGSAKKLGEYMNSHPLCRENR